MSIKTGSLGAIAVSLILHSGDVGFKSDVRLEDQGERTDLCFPLVEGTKTKRILEQIEQKAIILISGKNDYFVFDTWGTFYGITNKGSKPIYGMPGVSAEGCQEISLEPDSPNDTAVSEFLQARQIKDYEGMSRALQKMKK